MEKEGLKKLLEVEDLAEKKAKIHARLLMDTSLAKAMEELSLRHEKRKETIELLLYGKLSKKEKQGGMSASTEEESEK